MKHAAKKFLCVQSACQSVAAEITAARRSVTGRGAAGPGLQQRAVAAGSNLLRPVVFHNFRTFAEGAI